MTAHARLSEAAPARTAWLQSSQDTRQDLDVGLASVPPQSISLASFASCGAETDKHSGEGGDLDRTHGPLRRA